MAFIHDDFTTGLPRITFDSEKVFDKKFLQLMKWEKAFGNGNFCLKNFSSTFEIIKNKF